MSKANQYHLSFRVFSDQKGLKLPRVECGTNQPGETINDEIANFMNELGVNSIDLTIDLIYSCDPFNSSNDGFSVRGSNDEIAFIYSPPARIVFNNGGEDISVPLQDFIDILNEWKDFLNSLPYEHTLSNM